MEKATINLNTKQLIKYCSNGNLSNEELFRKLSLINRKSESSVHNVFGYRKFNDDFVDRVTVYVNEDGNSTIKLSYDDFLIKLFKYLNISKKPFEMTEEEIEETLNERLNVLNSSNIKQRLRYEFPLIYEDYIQGNNFLRDNQRGNINTPIDKKHKEYKTNYFYRCALHSSYNKFLDRQKDLYSRFVTRREDYKKAIETGGLNHFFNKFFDMDKVAMYIANSYLNICDLKDDPDFILDYVSLVEDYLNSDYDKSVEIEVENNRKINIDVIKERLAEAKKKIAPEIALVDWELVPAGKDYIVRGEPSYHRRKALLSEEELAFMREKGKIKTEFYDRSNPYAKAYSVLSPVSYVAYIYRNGEVLLDTIYDDDNPKTAIGNATYNIKAKDFDRISGLDKGELKLCPEARKINHSKHWEDRVNEIINRENNQSDREAAVKLVKRLKK